MNADLMANIEDVQRASSAGDILELVYKSIDQYGFRKFIISGLPDPGLDVRPFVLLSGWDAEWYERYTGLDYVHLDPVARHCFATTLPFDWSDAPYDRASDAPARRVMDEARDFGMGEGLCVPVHMEGGMQGVVSLVGETAHLDEKSRLELHMLALYVHGRLRYLHGSDEQAAPRRAITRREAEILKWVAAGKTAAEIADITGLTARTINQHCENAQRRLGTNNRLQTVVEAIRHKLITL
ncbi:helix-turn-helix transcriptional regulator [Devosia faecipullorum]|uniref:helix-turn-helix transcriptional regulator n=1 Tax=Devosia faecipullorum TaxID=2755039 RepID=UPI00187B415A|nr:LuxR family transcriptional regulator [Devosia faecipullorum]MBE7734294.1 LuxR family transcriptional regulator [Devosia faecipullorum]